MSTITKPDLEAFAFDLRYAPGGRGRRAKGQKTIQAYLYTVERYLAFLHGQTPTLENVRGFVKSLEGENGPRSVGRHIYALRAYFQHLGQTLDLGAPSYPKHLPRWLSDEEWGRVLEIVEAPLVNPKATDRARRRALFVRAALMAYGGAGLRLSEGCQLQREDLDLAGYLTVLGKGGEENIIPIEDAVLAALQDWLACHDSRWVFPGKGEDSHLHPRTMQGVIRDLLMEAGIENITRAVHMLRHTLGADLRKRGADIRDIQQVLRHSDIHSTQIYTQMSTMDLKKKLPRRLDVRQRRMML